jgi:hypothetical protein
MLTGIIFIKKITMPGMNDWVKLTYDGRPKRDFTESFTVSYTQKTNRLISFKQACTESAQEICDTYKNIYVSLSGGCDSECVANSFYDAGLPFTPVILKIEDYNRHDIKYALDWCAAKNINPVVIEQELLPWISVLAELQKLDRNRMLWGMSNVWLADYVKQLGGHLVTGCCDLQLVPDPDLQAEYSELNENFPKHYVQWESDYAVDHHDPGYHPNGFFIWKPEMILSFINERDPVWSNPEAKWRIYNVKPRPKYVGLENIDFKQVLSIIQSPAKIRNILGKHDWILAGTTETLWRDIYTGQKPA